MNRVCIKDRVCKECGNEFVGDRFTCPQCRHKKVKASGKFGAEYHRDYYNKFLKSGSKPRETKVDMKDKMRRAALARQAERIHREIAAIRRAGLDLDTMCVAEIMVAGVALEEVNGSNLLELYRQEVREAG